ncbi:hypothetical protein O3G_MSEX000342 [Manduca sexta]|nr:hypothetical protein O3G_MSEX000342 [Manduca sexta]
MALNNIEDVLDSYTIDCHSLEEAEQCKTKLTAEYNFKILTLNIRSINKNFDNLLVALKRMNIAFDIICLTECRLSNELVIPQMSGYKSFNTTKVINQNSGVVVYVKETWNVTSIEPNFDDADCLIIDIPKIITIFALYRSPSFKRCDQFFNALERNLVTYQDKSTLVLTGDININIAGAITDSISSEYLCLLAEHGMMSAISKPTRGSSILDHFFVRSQSPCQSVVCQMDLTDHNPIILGLSTKKDTTDRPCRLRVKRDIDNITKDLDLINWSSILDKSDVDKSANIFMETLLKIFDKHTQKIMISRSKFNLKPWVTPGLMRCMKHKDRLHMRTKSNPKDSTAKLIYTRYRNFFIDLIRKVKNDYDNQNLLQYKNNHKKLWKAIKDICHLNSTNTEPTELLRIAGTSHWKQSLDKCNEHFCTVGQKLASNILDSARTDEITLAAKISCDNSPVTSFFLEPTDVNEVDTMINQLSNGKAPGIDGIHNDLVKSIKKQIAAPLTDIFNWSLSAGIFPKVWKTAVVSPIHKGGDKHIPDNYRPISLLGVFSKLLEKILSKRLTKYLEQKNLISPKQFGFRQGKSANDAVCKLTSSVSELLDSGKKCTAVFLDLSKAFDTVSIPILLKKMELIGIRGVSHAWFSSYLSFRKQCVKVNNNISDCMDISFGVPQGSILGPTLFNIYINDIHKLPIKNSEIICYADDTVLLCHGDNWKDAFSNAEKGMQMISNWLKGNLLTLNLKKTNYICFHITSASAPPPSSSLKIHSSHCSNNPACCCECILKAEVVKYLGIFIDQKLNYHKQIDALSSKIEKLLA